MHEYIYEDVGGVSKKELFIESFGLPFSVSDNSKRKIDNFLEATTTASTGANKLDRHIINKKNNRNTFIIRGVPVARCDIPTANNNLYTYAELKKAMEKSMDNFKHKSLLCSAKGHPSNETAAVEPTEASHTVINGYIKKVGDTKILFNDFQVLSTDEGRNLASLIKDGVTIGTSIRVFGLKKEDTNNITDIEFLGTDAVGRPAAGTRFSKENIQAEILDESDSRDYFNSYMESSNYMEDRTMRRRSRRSERFNSNSWDRDLDRDRFNDDYDREDDFENERERAPKRKIRKLTDGEKRLLNAYNENPEKFDKAFSDSDKKETSNAKPLIDGLDAKEEEETPAADLPNNDNVKALITSLVSMVKDKNDAKSAN